RARLKMLAQSANSEGKRRICAAYQAGAKRSFLTNVAREAHAAELPARGGREEIAIARADVGGRRRAGSAAQDVLIRHELAVVFADRPRRRTIAGIRVVRTARPFPYVAKHLHRTLRCGRRRRMKAFILEKIAIQRLHGGK